MDQATLITALGGGTEVATWLTKATGEDVDREAVYKWRERGLIPWRWRPYLAMLAAEKKVSLPVGFLPASPSAANVVLPPPE